MASLSVIIITLNEEYSLPNCLNDLLAQTKQDFELLVVDSNSDDKTVTVAQSFADKFQNIKIIKMNERGVSLGRNTGVENSSGERILFLDADTRLSPNFIETSLLKLDAQNVDVGGVYMDVKVGTMAARITTSIMNIGFWVTKFISPTASSACLFSTRSAHQLINGFNSNIPVGEDCNYVLKSDKHAQIKFAMMPLYYKCDMRRFEQEGYLKLISTYAFLNIRRYFFGEYKKGQIEYKFGEHTQPKDKK